MLNLICGQSPTASPSMTPSSSASISTYTVGVGRVEAGSSAAVHEVDALTGATVTGDAVTSLVHYWFGPHGYQAFLAQLREQPPARPGQGS